MLRRGNGPEPDSLDPQLARTVSAATILRDVYEGLATLDANAAPVPGAAERWQVSADGRVYTFTLRAAARWSNGEPLVAADFVAAWRRLVDPATGSQYADVLKPVAGATEIVRGGARPETLGVVATDRRTLTVTLVAPTPYFPALVAHWSTFPTYHGVAPAAPGAHGLERRLHARRVAGRLARRRAPQPRVLERRRDAHRQRPLPAHRRCQRRVRPLPRRRPRCDLHAAAAAARAPGRGARRRAPPRAAARRLLLRLQPRAAGARNAGLRQALAMSVDRERLTAAVTGLGELPAYAWVPPGVAHYDAQRFAWTAATPATRLAERARRLYAAAGYSAARPLKLELRFASGPTHERIAIAVAAMWREALGVETRLVGEEFKSLLQTIGRGETEVFQASWIGDYNDAWTFAEVLGGEFGINLPHYRSAAYDAALARAAAAARPRRAAGGARGGRA